MLESPKLCAVCRRGTSYFARAHIGSNCCPVVWPRAVVNSHLVSFLGSLSGCLLLVSLASSTYGLILNIARRDGFDTRPGSAHGDALHTGVCEPCRPLVACSGKL